MTMDDWTSAHDSKINKRDQKDIMKSVEDYEPNLIEIMINSNFSRNAIDFWMKSGEAYISKMQTLKIHLHRLIKLRNKILTTLKSLDDFIRDRGITTCYSKDDFLCLASCLKKLVHDGYIHPHKLWDFKEKSKDQEVDDYDDDELSQQG
mmetsp:Transcript_7049/g.7915  ORF Transcript_7049/g.7915 Transcript_7049/m.7915 type:complete len:149 (+) Transcript_7049:425-871(+)|eukprot:CAMPEP_0205827394 /NCGR_PEP_ID=MMETSP0206-20130828/31839_1 /ASSEMBLY_ACC=CAM_ASM_000279 /TAXON_ID=36767 /ORGANISM="Euplotes focardii, Strain TN1" /LENGTH=148 /DNA_ID=CAMNT_0053128257 /DNA_START=425 /DNA_END=871 /DNA_ORIENTATION=-